MITLQHMPDLTEPAARLLRRGGDSVNWAIICSAIKTNAAQLFAVSNGSYLVLRIENKELLILAAAGTQAKILMQLCCQAAQKNGCDSVVFYTVKKGLLRLLKNFKPEQVYRQKYRVTL